MTNNLMLFGQKSASGKSDRMVRFREALGNPKKSHHELTAAFGLTPLTHWIE
jgi:hypothetical protein